MSTKTSPRRVAARAARKAERLLPAGYATFGRPDGSGKYATFDLPYPVNASR